MGRLLKLELNKAFGNAWFFVSLAICLVLAIAAAFTEAASASLALKLKDSGASEWIVLSTQGSYLKSLLLGTCLWREAFFLLLPLLVVIPYSCSLRSEIIDGLLNQAYIRAPRRKYLAAKGLAAFCAGAVVAAVPLVVNFIAISCMLPAYPVDVVDTLYVMVESCEAFSSLLYSAPLAYIAVNVIVDAILCGAWAVLVLAASSFVDNRVALLAGSYLLVLLCNYLNQVVFRAFGVNGFAFSLIELTKGATSGSYLRYGFWLFVVLGVIALSAVATLRFRRDSDVL